jgi:hypothetical protein
VPAGAWSADAGGLQEGGSCAMPLAAIDSRRTPQQKTVRLDVTALNRNQPRFLEINFAWPSYY